MFKFKKVTTIVFASLLTVSLAGAGGVIGYVSYSQSQKGQNNGNNTSPPGSGSGEENKPNLPEQGENEYNYELWNNNENRNNKFSTVSSNGKLDIVKERGANDILDSDFNDGRGNANPLNGDIINEQYKRLAQISFSVNFAISSASYLGTSWILDYEIPNGVQQRSEGNSYTDSTYPTKWYMATNTHVMDDLKTPYSIYKETNTSSKLNSSTTNVYMTKIKDPQIGDGGGLYKKSSWNNTAYETFNFKMTGMDDKPLKDQPVRPVFLGFDYLESKPSDFINNVPQPASIPDDVEFSHVEELADFSVFEIDFTKIYNDEYSEYETPQKMAKAFSSNYANWKESDKFKPATKSLINDPESRKNDFYALGFPQEVAIDGGQRDTRYVSLFINRPSNLSEDKKSLGAKLVNERHYNTFKNAPGIFDLVIGSADFGYKSDPISNVVATSGIIPHIYQGLAYTDQNGDMWAGSSGSIFVDQNNNIYCIHFASDFTAHVGINFALMSEGYNYNGQYGVYNLQPYDLINGGYKNQKQSYKSQLNKLYPNGLKTNIFKNGIKD